MRQHTCALGRPATLILFVTCCGAIAAAQSGQAPDAVQDSSGQEVARRYIERGNSLAKDGRFDEAAEAYRRAVGHDPAAALAYGNLGYVYSRLGRYAEA